MASGADSGTTTLAPDEAFAVLGNETRMEILQTLGQADEPLKFSELYDQIDYDTTANFNYHLERLTGHFLRKTDDGYELRQAGRRVIEAVLSGAVTEAVVIEPTRLDAPCPYCGAAIEVSYREERVLIRCTECVGSFPGVTSTSGAFGTLPDGTLTLYYLPSAAIQGRSPHELLDVAIAWTYIEFVTVAKSICPRCTSVVSHSVEACTDHETDKEICDNCNQRFAVVFTSRCTNCDYWIRGTIKHHLLGDHRVRAFLEARGVDTLAPAWEDMSVLYNYEEAILATDPFEARITFTVDGDDLIVTIDDDLSVIDVRHG